MTADEPSRNPDRLRVLVVRVGAMGDILHALPAIAGLRHALPGVDIGWAIEPHWAPLLQGADGASVLVDCVHPVPTKKWKARPVSRATLEGIAAMRGALRARRYDICVDLQGSVRSAIIGRMAGASRLVGAEAPWEGVAKLLYSKRVSLTAQHVVGQACALVSAAVGVKIEACPVRFPIDIEAEVWADGVLARAGFSRFALLIPTAGWGAKEWRVGRYEELTQHLRRLGLGVLVNASASGMLLQAKRLEQAVQAFAPLATLPQLVALTRRAALVVGGDTGPVHLAAALGRPVVALFGPTDPLRNGPYFPWNEQVRVLRQAASKTSYKRSQQPDAGLAQIEVEVVMQAAQSLLDASAERARGGVSG